MGLERTSSFSGESCPEKLEETVVLSMALRRLKVCDARVAGGGGRCEASTS